MGLAVKPYPSCRYSHGDGRSAPLRTAHDLDADAISAVEIGLPETGQNIIGTPLAQNTRPRRWSTANSRCRSWPPSSYGRATWLGRLRPLAERSRDPRAHPQGELCGRSGGGGGISRQYGRCRARHGRRRTTGNHGTVPKGSLTTSTEAELVGKFDGLTAPISAPRAAQLAAALFDRTRNRRSRRSWN